MHLSITEYSLSTHVFGDAADTTSCFEDNLRARRGGIKAQEAVPVYQDLEVATYTQVSQVNLTKHAKDGCFLLICEVKETCPYRIRAFFWRVLDVFRKAFSPSFERDVEIAKGV